MIADCWPAVALALTYPYGVAPCNTVLTATPTVSAPATVASVSFYAGTPQLGTLLGTVTAAPWVWPLEALPTGSYNYSAQVTDSLGNTAQASAPLTVINMRNDFGEFATTPEPLLEMWLNVAVNQVNADRWGALTTLGWELLTAHYTSIALQDLAVNNFGGIPGVVNGPATAKSADKVSVSKDTAAVTLERGGDLNMTSYGIRWLRIARMMGAGGMQLNVGWPGPGSFYGGGLWSAFP